MIIDTSAIVAIRMQEPTSTWLADRLAEAGGAGVGAPTLVEAGVVLRTKLKIDSIGVLARMMSELGLREVSFGPMHWTEALHAYATYGQGRHPAGLNLGDTYSYAMAKVAKEPLLCIGDDFPRTDLEIVQPPRELWPQ